MHRCAFCGKLFTLEQREWMQCKKAKIFIDFHGSVIAKHVVDRSWEINKFVSFIREKYHLSWRRIYWKIWAHTVTMECSVC